MSYEAAVHTKAICLDSLALTIGAGTSETMRNIIARSNNLVG